MMRQALTLFPFPWLMAIALGLFLSAYVMITIHTLSRKARARQDRLSQLPLKED